jgi:CarD family transcriptional regulator
LNFVPGQVLVHPHHGPATVTQVVTRLVRNRRGRYLKLDVHNSDLSIAVPAEQAEEIGIRPILDVDGVREVFEVLLAPGGEKEKVWSRRIKNNADRLRSGDIRTIAGLIRDLTRWNTEKRLSYGETAILRDARGPFETELALVLSMTEDDVIAMVDAAILKGTRPALAGTQLAAAS